MLYSQLAMESYQNADQCMAQDGYPFVIHIFHTA